MSRTRYSPPGPACTRCPAAEVSGRSEADERELRRGTNPGYFDSLYSEPDPRRPLVDERQGIDESGHPRRWTRNAHRRREHAAPEADGRDRRRADSLAHHEDL